ncbi:PAS domain S-box protein [Schinkia azotoformans]|uniref:PAS domain S-box protein n=1 Tax=Schinkia azotoformans TaxID=1454 RepID=UPI002DB813FF|nr:PAS domain S-box protein [Schinkia azotoformans]MEC1759865.1 PAS domain S-box protein [Schinkia azotoformans]
MSLLFSESAIEIYKSIIENNTDAIFVLSTEGTFIEANSIITKLYGYSKEEIEGNHYQNLIVPEHIEITNQNFKKALQGTPCEYETKVFHKSGEILHVLVKNIPLMDHGKIIGVFGVAIDKTEFYKTRASLYELKERVKLLYESNGDAIDILDLGGNIVDVNPAFERLYGWKREELMGRPIPIIPEYRFHEHIELMEQIKAGKPVKRNEAICMKKDGNPIYVNLTLSPLSDEKGNIVGFSGITRDITKQKELEKSLAESEERYREVVELLPKGLVIHRDGVILYANPYALKITKEEDIKGKRIIDFIPLHCHDAFKERVKRRIQEQRKLPMTEYQLVRSDGEIVDIEVNSTSIKFDKEEAILTLFKDITDRKKIERDLKKSQKNLADIYMALNESSIVAITNEEGIIEFANDQFCKISKYSREELIGQNHRILKSGYHSKEFFENLWETIKEGEIWRGEIRNKAKDGTLYWVESTIVPFLNEEGKPYQYVAIRNNITERKQAEEDLRHSEERYRKLVEMSPEPIIVHTDGIIQFVNNAGLKVFKVGSIEELIGKHVLNFVHPEDLKKVIARMQSLEEIGTIEDFIEERIVLYDGSTINLEVSGVGIIYEGKPSVQLLLRDLTERKKIEEALRQSEKKYRLIAENMTDLVTIMDSKGFVKYASPSHEFVLGFSPKAYEGKVAFDFIHPEDLRHVQSQFSKMIKTKVSHSVEFRHKHANGDWIWIESKGTPIGHKDGEIQHIHVVSREITERIMYEEKLSYMAYHDLLTGLPNRRLFQEKLKQSLLEAERYHRKLAVMYMDIDKFKQINDTLGHDVGDELLVQFAQRVKECLRESDTLGRQGGDEFTILLPEIQKETDAVNIAKRILYSLQEPWSVKEHAFHITSSIGIAYYPADGITGNQLIKHADKALYGAKEDGRNNFKTYA